MLHGASPWHLLFVTTANPLSQYRRFFRQCVEAKRRMKETEHLGQLFESERDHLRAVAYRMLGSATEADDAVQETWLRLNRSDAASIENLGGWLTTVIARVCLDMLRSHKSRREESFEAQVTEPVAETSQAMNPEQEALLADSVGVALLVVLETLT